MPFLRRVSGHSHGTNRIKGDEPSSPVCLEDLDRRDLSGGFPLSRLESDALRRDFAEILACRFTNGNPEARRHQSTDIARISPETYRRLSAAITGETLDVNGEQVALVPENAAKIRAAVRILRSALLKERNRTDPMVRQLEMFADDAVKHAPTLAKLTRQSVVARATREDRFFHGPEMERTFQVGATTRPLTAGLIGV